MNAENVIIREKRRNPRVKEAIPVELVLLDEVNTAHGLTKDLSCVGAKIIMDHSLPSQTQYSITLDLPAGKQHLQGIVVRSEKIKEDFEISLYFNDITMETRRRINDFVKEKWV